MARKDIRCRIPGWLFDQLNVECYIRGLTQQAVVRAAVQALVYDQLGEIEPIDRTSHYDEKYVSVYVGAKLRVEFRQLLMHRNISLAQAMRNCIYAYLESDLLDELEPSPTKLRVVLC